MNDGDIDLRPYVLILLKNKWWIILIGILFGVVALTASLLTQRVYTATATLLLTRSRSMLSLADQFPTIAEPVDSRSRMDALMAIAKGDAIANMTLQSLGDSIPENYRSIEDIISIVSVQNNGDSISVSTTTNDPQLSANIANTWTDHIVETINIAYSGEQPLIKIQERLQTAEEEYDSAQKYLENFIRENPKKGLETRLNEANSVLTSFGNETAVQMIYYMNRKQAMEELQEQATALKGQLESGNRSAAGNVGDALAVILARMNAISSKSIITSVQGATTNPNPQSPTSNVIPQQNAIINLQIDGNFPSDGTAGYSADIDAIIDLAQEEKNKADENIQWLMQQVVDPDQSRLEVIARAGDEIQALEQQLEEARSTELELTSNRNLAWEAYQALSQKEAEIKNATLTNNQVTLASQAVVPNIPDPRGTVQKTVIAGLVGVLIGIIIVLGLFWWRQFNLTDALE